MVVIMEPKKQSPSDVPDYVRYDELPRTVCYNDVDLFVIRNPEGGSAVLVVVIEFRNLKGRQQGQKAKSTSPSYRPVIPF